MGSPVTSDLAAPAAAGRTAVKIAALAAGFVMASLDTTVVNVAGARIQQDLAVSVTELTWIVDGYVLTFAALLLLAGGMANRLGSLRVYMWGMAVFVAASLACAVAPDGAFLIGARLVQGAGAALFMPSSLALLVRSFPDTRQRTRILGLWSAIVATASGIGPTVGGLMVSAFGWPSIFLINLPIGLLGAVLTWRYITPTARKGAPVPFGGHALAIAMVAAMCFALIEGPEQGWLAPAVLIAYAVAIASAAALVLRERKTSSHVIPWELFRLPPFAGGNVIGFLFNFALFGGIFVLGLFLQQARGVAPFTAGLQLLPMTVFFPISNIVYSKISGRYSNGLLLTVFLGIAAASTVSLVFISPATSYWQLALAMGLANIGAGIISPAMTAVLVDAAGVEHAAIAGSVLNANRQFGSLFGIAAMGVAISVNHDWYARASVAFAAITIAYLLGAVCAWRTVWKPRLRQ
ncbi:MFS transporter [Amycolatopsis australiensis]|uniref:MFS transporter, DHA2 family, methylenomycin A resistance protein n=1 Tax=Amycolatopsis australiensis TaxID=546364 RepID=A0A1K1S2L3_9PSEU|nr:MFS transporter [Amycolatopsis australiensis]SFW78648.1 MFS transporter, DHA2 family, methylenomycin A resistance protein [Amycolatopsis australiensis]